MARFVAAQYVDGLVEGLTESLPWDAKIAVLGSETLRRSLVDARERVSLTLSAIEVANTDLEIDRRRSELDRILRELVDSAAGTALERPAGDLRRAIRAVAGAFKA